VYRGTFRGEEAESGGESPVKYGVLECASYKWVINGLFSRRCGKRFMGKCHKMSRVPELPDSGPDSGTMGEQINRQIGQNMTHT